MSFTADQIKAVFRVFGLDLQPQAPLEANQEQEEWLLASLAVRISARAFS